MDDKPLKMKAYTSICHLPGSKLGEGDHTINPGQARMCTEKSKEKNDVVVVTEKVDGTCTSVAKVDGQLYALGRAGYETHTSPYDFIREFGIWMQYYRDEFDEILEDGERIVGEWMIRTHGIPYNMPHEPWVAFDILRGNDRLCYDEFSKRIDGLLPTAGLIHKGEPIAVEEAYKGTGYHGSIEMPEGMVYRVERKDKVLFLAKWVRHDMVPGKYLSIKDDVKPAMWNTFHIHRYTPTCVR